MTTTKWYEISLWYYNHKSPLCSPQMWSTKCRIVVLKLSSKLKEIENKLSTTVFTANQRFSHKDVLRIERKFKYPTRHIESPFYTNLNIKQNYIERT